MRIQIRLIAAAVAVLAIGQASAQSYGYRTYSNDGYRNARVVRCESRSARATSCRVDTRGGVRLSQRLSRNACTRGRTWGTSNNAIWVSNGCRANFTVQYRQDSRRVADNRYRDDNYSNDGYRNDGYRNDGYRNDGYRNDDYQDEQGDCVVDSHGRVYCESTDDSQYDDRY